MGLSAAAALTEIGVGAETAAVIAPVVGTAAEGAGAGAVIGGGEAALTGGNVGKGALKGAEGGAITGGGIGIGGDIAGALGATAGSTGAYAGDILGGAAGGALGAEVTGSNPLIGALEGGIAGGGVAYNAAGAPVNSSGATTAAPANTTSTMPSAGGGFTGANSAIDATSGQIDAQIKGLSDLTSDIPGASTANATGMGSLMTGSGASANSAIGAAGSDAIGSTGGNAGTGTFDLAGNMTSGGAPAPMTGGGVPAPAGGGASTGSWKDFLPSKSQVGTAALGAIPMAYEAIKGPAALPADAKNLQSGGAATAPLLAIENQNATEATTGQLTPAQEASITQFVSEQQNQILQQLASQGVTDPTKDSRYISAMNNLQQQVLAMQQQYVQQAITNATSAGGAASTNIATAANEQIQNDTAFTDAMAQAFAALGGSVSGVKQPAAA